MSENQKNNISTSDLTNELGEKTNEQHDKKQPQADKPAKKKLDGKTVKIIVIVILILAALIGAVTLSSVISRNREAQITIKSTLEKIVNVSDLSTFEAVYNGIAKVMNEKRPDRVDYYVSYDAKVKAGIDFEKVDISVDDENKMITVTLPKIKITEVNVDIASLDYIFENNRANTSTISEQAYKKCIEDVTNECSAEKAIFTLAEQNARNIIEALLSPFIDQFYDEYELQIVLRG